MSTSSGPEDLWDDDAQPTPEELAETEAVFEALAAGLSPTGEPTIELLASLRADLDERAARAPVVAIEAGRSRTRRRLGRGAVAGLVISGVAFSGSGVAAALTSEPGDLLYPVRTAIAGPVNDNNNRMVARLIVRAKSLDAAPLSGATKTEAAAVINSAARIVPAIKDPGRRKKAVKELQHAQQQLGLSPSPIPTATSSPLHVTTSSPSPADTSSPSPTTDPTSSPAPVAVASPSASDAPSPSPSRHKRPSRSPHRTPKASTSPRRSPKPSPSATSSPSASPRVSRSPRTSPSASPELSASAHEAGSSQAAPASPSPS